MQKHGKAAADEARTPLLTHIHWRPRSLRALGRHRLLLFSSLKGSIPAWCHSAKRVLLGFLNRERQKSAKGNPNMTAAAGHRLAACRSDRKKEPPQRRSYRPLLSSHCTGGHPWEIALENEQLLFNSRLPAAPHLQGCCWARQSSWPSPAWFSCCQRPIRSPSWKAQVGRSRVSRPGGTSALPPAWSSPALARGGG